MWSGAEYGVTWDEESATVPSDVYFARISPAGAVLESGAVTTTSEVDWWPTIAWCGQYAIVHQRGRGASGEEGDVRLVYP